METKQTPGPSEIGIVNIENGVCSMTTEQERIESLRARDRIGFTVCIKTAYDDGITMPDVSDVLDNSDVLAAIESALGCKAELLIADCPNCGAVHIPCSNCGSPTVCPPDEPGEHFGLCDQCDEDFRSPGEPK